MKTDIIIYFIKLFVISIYSYYCFIKMLNVKKQNSVHIIIIVLTSFILGAFCTYIKFFINSFLSVIILCFLYGIILGVITKSKIGYSLIITFISYAICTICQVTSVAIEYIPYILFRIRNSYLNLIIISIIQFILIYRFFKIKRFKNGFDFLHKKLNNEFADIIMINISIAVILSSCLLGTMLEGIE